MKGCPLRCLWCHNPETQKKRQELLFYADQCVCCGRCVKACQNGAHLLQTQERDFGKPVHIYVREKCTLCGACAAVCPAEALEMTGEDVEASKVVKRLLRDRAFYENSGGGVTLSGGEPLFQLAFTEEILRGCKAEGLHTCLDTSGVGASPEEISRLTKEHLVDLYLYDLKETDDARHRDATGVPFQTVLDNLEAVSCAGGRIRLRCPIIPGVNDRDAHLSRVGAIAETLPGVEAVDLIPYHRLGLVKAMALSESQQEFAALEEEQKKAFSDLVKHETKKPVQWL